MPESPKDSDGDGVSDVDDQCPAIAGNPALQGCPDKDKDGVRDDQDKCPEQPGLKKFDGCPDSDNDGIQDAEDKCPGTAGMARYQGCPIPDGDADGVNDETDKCPGTAGLLEFNGCPKIRFNPDRVHFDKGSVQLSGKSKAVLDLLVNVMLNDHPQIRIILEGHTDDAGSDDLNQHLSVDRANAVKAYLVFKNVDPERILVTGFGKLRPVGDNTTTPGKKMNRRVEFIVAQ